MYGECELFFDFVVLGDYVVDGVIYVVVIDFCEEFDVFYVDVEYGCFVVVD